MDTQWLSSSEAETIRIGKAFGKHYICDGAVVCVRGELGAGKTHFIKGIASSLGIDERELTSPTFALAHEFPLSRPLPSNGRLENSSGPATLYHLDCYRFEKPDELLELGVEDYLYPHHAATIIEWPERIARLIPEDAVHVELRVISETEREIQVRSKPAT